MNGTLSKWVKSRVTGAEKRAVKRYCKAAKIAESELIRSALTRRGVFKSSKNNGSNKHATATNGTH